MKKHLDDTNAFATVATLQPDGRAHLTVVWITREGDDLLFSTTATRQQGRNAARDERVTVLIQPPDSPYAYAEVRGTATVTPDTDHTFVNQVARKFTGKDYADFNPASVSDGERVIVRVTPDKVTGRL
nr:PPOX class F420-dependent oxidoreductase [Streptomyces coryli]